MARTNFSSRIISFNSDSYSFHSVTAGGSQHEIGNIFMSFSCKNTFPNDVYDAAGNRLQFCQSLTDIN